MRRERPDIAFLVFAIVAALVIRLDFLIASDFVIDSDEGIVGLMAKHIAEGRALPAFYYGQHYMGSLEPLLVGVAFKIFGISAVALKCVPLAFSLALVPLIYLLGREFGGKVCARIATLLWAVPPSPLVIWSSMARGGFIEIVFIITLTLLLAVRWLKAERPSPNSTAVVGALLGLGWWVNNQIVFILLPIGFFFLLRLARERSRRLEQIGTHLVVGLAAFLVGGVVFWTYNIGHDFASFGIFGAVAERDLLRQLTGLFTSALPVLLGGKRFWHEEDLISGSTPFVLGLYGLVLVLFLAIRLRSIVDLFVLRVNGRDSAEILLAFIVTALAAFALSSYGHLVTAPRYLLPIYPAIFVIVGIVAERIWHFNRIFGGAVVSVILALNVSSSYAFGRAIPGQPFVTGGERASANHQELLDWLVSNHHKYVETNYWIGYRLAFESLEQVKFIIFREPFQVRIPEYEEEGRAYGRFKMPLVLVPSQAPFVRRALETLGITYREIQLSGYVVIYDRQLPHSDLKPLEPSALRAETTLHHGDAQQAIDGNAGTRWGSATPQSPGMSFVIELDQPRALRALQYDIGRWYHDEPRGLRIETENAQGERSIVLTEDQYRAVQYLQAGGEVLTLYFAPRSTKRVILTQTGQDSFFDWSIAEFTLFE